MIDVATSSLELGQIVLAVINAAQAVAIAWLVNRRSRADAKHDSFEETVRWKLGLPFDKKKIRGPNGKRGNGL
jgi:hypothetical protein